MKILSQSVVNGHTVLDFETDKKYEKPVCMRIYENGEEIYQQYFDAESQLIQVEFQHMNRGSHFCVICFYEAEKLIYRYSTRCVNYSEKPVSGEILVDRNLIVRKAESLFQKEEVNLNVNL